MWLEGLCMLCCSLVPAAVSFDKASFMYRQLETYYDYVPGKIEAKVYNFFRIGFAG